MYSFLLLSYIEYKVPTPEEEWKKILAVDADITPESVLRKLLPLILRGILKGLVEYSKNVEFKKQNMGFWLLVYVQHLIHSSSIYNIKHWCIKGFGD